MTTPRESEIVLDWPLISEAIATVLREGAALRAEVAALKAERDEAREASIGWSKCYIEMMAERDALLAACEKLADQPAINGSTGVRYHYCKLCYINEPPYSEPETFAGVEHREGCVLRAALAGEGSTQL